MALDPGDPNVIYLSGAYGSVGRFDRRIGLSQDVSPWPAIAFEAEIDQRKYRAPWSPVLVSGAVDPKTLYFGTQYVMKTADGGLHWETISGDLTGAVQSQANGEVSTPPTLANAKQRGYGVVSTIAPSPRSAQTIWAGSNTGLVHLTRDGGKTWKDVTPPGLTDWSEISVIEASHFDPAVAYITVNRARLDDQRPYIYRTRDYGATWQLTVDGIAPAAFLRAVREDPQTKGLLFAGTELGVYISFDDGDHWQPLQLNLPATSVRDLTVHGDDLVIATFGRAFWILDDITPLRQTQAAEKASQAWLFRPAKAIRVDNDVFVGTPLPPEEPTAENPPNGAVIDYVLRSPANRVTLEVFDTRQNLLRRFSSEDKKPARHPALAIAERWLPEPARLETSPGMHRFVWDLTSAGIAPSTEEESFFRSPTGPKLIPGTYQLRLTVDGRSQTQPLDVAMDPRSPATPAVLAQQFELGKKMFDQAVQARQALAEINSIQKQIAQAQQNPAAQSGEIKAALAEAESALAKMLRGGKSPQEQGLQGAYSDLTSALRVVENGDRTTPSQAMEVYEQTSGAIKARMSEWTTFKQTRLPEFNRQLRQANLTPITIAEIAPEADFVSSQ